MAPANCAIFMVIFACFGYNVLAAPCTMEQMMECIGAISDIDASDIDKTCNTANKMVACIEGLKTTCEMSEQMQSQLDSQSASMDQFKEMCKGSENSEGGCSTNEMTACMEPLSSMQEGDVTKMCSVMNTAVECLTTLKSKCGNEALKSAIQESMDKMANNAMCSSDSCPLSEMKTCMESFEKMGNDKSAVCKIMKDGVKCLEDLKPTCNDEQKKQIQTAIDSMGPVDNECCEAVVKVQKECAPGIMAIAENFEAKDEQCMKMENAWTCVSGHSPKCKSGPLKTGMDEAVLGIKGRLDECTQKGYNVSVNYNKQEGKAPIDSGVALHPTLALLLTALLMGLYSYRA